MESNKLELKEEKTEAMVVGSRSRTSVSGTGLIEISSSLVSFQPSVKDLEGVLDSGLTILFYFILFYFEVSRMSFLTFSLLP